MSGGYEKAIRENAPQAEVCFDPFHVVRLAQRAVDQVRRDEWNAHDRSHTKTGKWIKNTRWSLLKSPEKQTIRQLARLGEVQQANKPMFRVLPAQRRAPAALPPRRPRPRASPPRSLARLGIPVTPRPIRQAGPHDPTTPPRHPRRRPPRPLQRPPRRPQQPHPPNQPPQLRIPLRRPPDRPRLPLLRRRCHLTTTMTSPPKRPEHPTNWTRLVNRLFTGCLGAFGVAEPGGQFRGGREKHTLSGETGADPERGCRIRRRTAIAGHASAAVASGPACPHGLASSQPRLAARSRSEPRHALQQISTQGRPGLGGGPGIGGDAVLRSHSRRGRRT